jgi:hypothetical protein
MKLYNDQRNAQVFNLFIYLLNARFLQHEICKINFFPLWNSNTDNSYPPCLQITNEGISARAPRALALPRN